MGPWTQTCRVKSQAGIAANSPGHWSALDSREGVKNGQHDFTAAAGKSG